MNENDDVGVRTGDPDTSHAAASVTAKVVTILESRVVAYVKGQGSRGATTAEIAYATRIRLQSVTPRMKPLVRKGKLARTTDKRLFPGETVPRIVWVAR